MYLLILFIAVVSLGLIKCTGFGDKTALNIDDFAKYEDCDDILKRGQYQKPGAYFVYLNSSKPITVYCDFDLNSGMGKHVIMQQKYGHVSFRRNFFNYTHGFGSMRRGDFWIGLHNIWSFSIAGYNVLTLTLQDWSNKIKQVRYNHFSIGSGHTGYRLYIGGYDPADSQLPDDLTHNDGKRFATIDRPDINRCALNQGGGWWYNYCSFTLPTGHYYHGGPYRPPGKFYNGIYYKDWHGYAYSLKYIKMELSRH